jgi:hypothetical protein
MDIKPGTSAGLQVCFVTSAMLLFCTYSIGSSAAGTTEALRYTLLHCTADPIQPAPPEDELILAPDSGCRRCRNEIRTILWSERTIQHGRRATC